MYPNPDISGDVLQVTPGYTAGYYYMWKGNDNCVALGANDKLTNLLRELDDHLSTMIEDHANLKELVRE
jgi:hypothetical protein